HERRPKMAGDDMRMNGALQHEKALVERGLPKCLSEFGEFLPTPNVIHQDVESALLFLDPGEKLFYLRRLAMVDLDGDTSAAAGSHHFGGLLDGLRSARSRGFAGDASARAVDGGARLSQGTGNPPPRAAGGARDHGDFTCQILFHCGYFKLEYGPTA